ncbi:MAG: hypothetical protein KGL43_13595 [Burkholderiales bacterium]|nr:hypothetical protein [Burkholderiales bacterium]MDE2395423.1 hypothetical protein [Burkholderiales bacterium]MDE2454621.1 hypothetical protein [Burkholderiales bacterium]
MKYYFKASPGSSSNRIGADLSVMLCAILPYCKSASSDETCGPSESQCVNSIAGDLQGFAPKMTKSGRFTVKEEYPDGAPATTVLSFLDRGQTAFTRRIAQYDNSTGTAFDPGAKKCGLPGLKVQLLQGTMGACVYYIAFRENRFRVYSSGLKQNPAPR